MNFLVNAPATSGARAVNIQANDLAWDPVNQVIYLSLPSLDGPNGNSVQILEPNSGNLGASAFAGSEPNLLSVSANSKYLYVSLNGSSNVQRLTLPALGTDIQIHLGSDPFDGPFYAMDLQASPASDGAVAVVRGAAMVSPMEEGGVVIYDDGTARPNVLCGWIQSNCPSHASLYDSVQWNNDATMMFAQNNEDTAFNFYSIPVTSAGFGSQTDFGALLSGFGESIHYDSTTGDVYGDYGGIVDPIAGTLIGTFAASGLMIPDGAHGKAFFLGQTSSQTGTSNFTIESFDIQKFTPIATLTIANVAGSPTHLIRWGTNGLAFTTTNNGSGSNQHGEVYLISGSFVDGRDVPKLRPVENVRWTWNSGKGPLQSPAVSKISGP